MPAGEIKNLTLKVIFLVHFIGMSLSTMSFWSTRGYLFYNTIFILILLWAILQKNDEDLKEPLQLGVVVNSLSIFFDIILLITSFPPPRSTSRDVFAAAICIIHLILRPCTTVLLVRLIIGRNLNGTGFIGHDPTSYEDIDRNQRRPTTSNAGNYSFPTAQEA